MLTLKGHSLSRRRSEEHGLPQFRFRGPIFSCPQAPETIKLMYPHHHIMVAISGVKSLWLVLSIPYLYRVTVIVLGILSLSIH
jgi:hypothetical protein